MKEDENHNELLIIYQSAISLQTHEGDLVWSRFNGFVVTHTIFFAIIGQTLINKEKVEDTFLIMIMVSLVGIALSFFWLMSTVRGFEAVNFWNYTTYELAAKINKINRKNKIPNIFLKGYEYFKENKEVFFELGENRKCSHIQRSWLTRYIRLHTTWTAYLSIVIVGISYIIILIATFYRLI